jgi:hypothetical protein
MKRRTLLRAVTGGAAAAIAGCTGGPGGGAGDEGDGASGGAGTTTTPTPSVSEASLEMGGVTCGVGDPDATVAMDGGTVTVEGSLTGSNGCARARLGEAGYVDGTLTVAVESYTETGGVCKDCIVDVSYTAVVRMGTGPERVVVTHDGETITEAPAAE